MRNIQTVLMGLGAVLLLSLSGATMVFWRDRIRLTAQLRESDELFKKFQQESTRLETEKAQMTHEHEALQSDVMTYVANNTKLQQQADDLGAKLKDASTQLMQKPWKSKSCRTSWSSCTNR